MFLVDAGLGTPRICMQDELTGVPINRAARFDTLKTPPTRVLVVAVRSVSRLRLRDFAAAGGGLVLSLINISAGQYGLFSVSGSPVKALLWWSRGHVSPPPSIVTGSMFPPNFISGALSAAAVAKETLKDRVTDGKVDHLGGHSCWSEP
ncbi:hypothetical protein ACOSP7_019799 [Xanthoceras sorbifolium]